MRIIVINQLTGTRADLRGRPVSEAYQIINQASQADGEVHVQVHMYPETVEEWREAQERRRS